MDWLSRSGDTAGPVSLGDHAIAPVDADQHGTSARMMRRLRAYIEAQLDRVRAWLYRHPRIDRALDRTGCLRFDRRSVARGTGVGLFVALTPTVGVQTWMMLGGCLLMRGNFPAAFVVSWISNPITVAPLYMGYHALGETVFGPIVNAGMQLAGYDENLALEIVYVALGSLLVALPIAVAGYALLLWGWRSWIVQRRTVGYAARCAQRREAAKQERAEPPSEDSER